MLDEALFTAPAHPNWGGTAMLDDTGSVCAVGSLLVQQVTQSGDTIAGNMMVPTDLLKPILNDLRQFGRVQRAPRPWLGMLVQEHGNGLVVGGVYEGGPADRAGVRAGDQVLRIADREPVSLADFFRRAWAVGPAGSSIPVTLYRDEELIDVDIASVDRDARLKHGPCALRHALLEAARALETRGLSHGSAGNLSCEE